MKKENTNRKICQVGVLTRDAEQSTRACMEDLGIGPWTIMTMNQENVTDVVMYDQNISHPFGYYCATAMIGNFQIEYMVFHCWDFHPHLHLHL